MERQGRGGADLFTNPLPTKFALDRVLDDGIVASPSVDRGNEVEAQADAYEVEDFV